MRILTVTSSFPKHRGDTTAPFIASITEALARRGHELTVVLPARDDLDPEPIEGVRFRAFRYAPTRGLAVFGYAEALRADVALKRATYVAAPLALVAGAMALFSESRRAAYDVVHAHWVVPNGAMAWPAVRFGGLPLVVSLHGSDVFLSEQRGPFRSACRLAFSHARGATACSDDLASRSLSLGAREKPEVIPYGVDTHAFGASPGATLRRRHGIRDDEPVVVAVGRLVHKKGFEFLIDAAAKLKKKGCPVRVVIAGKGDLREALEIRSRSLGVRQCVDFVGDVPRGELPSYFGMADVVAVPSIQDDAGNVDGLPNVLLEAMASGKAIVASQVAGIPSAIRDGRDGVLVPEKDDEALASAIERLSASKDLRRELGEAARRRAEREFSWSLVGERFESVLRTVAQARG